MRNTIRSLWRGIRQLSGDDAHERYLAHYAQYHRDDSTMPLSKAEFFKQWQDGQWQGIRRCC